MGKQLGASIPTQRQRTIFEKSGLVRSKLVRCVPDRSGVFSNARACSRPVWSVPTGLERPRPVWCIPDRSGASQNVPNQSGASHARRFWSEMSQTGPGRLRPDASGPRGSRPVWGVSDHTRLVWDVRDRPGASQTTDRSETSAIDLGRLRLDASGLRQPRLVWGVVVFVVVATIYRLPPLLRTPFFSLFCSYVLV